MKSKNYIWAVEEYMDNEWTIQWPVYKTRERARTCGYKQIIRGGKWFPVKTRIRKYERVNPERELGPFLKKLANMKANTRLA